MLRKATVAGQFYAASKNELERQIRNCFLHELGPGRIPSIGKKIKKREIKGLVVPHAGYPYSGHVAAHSYCALAEDGFPDSFVILGPNHTGYGSAVAVITEGEWSTPLGKIKIDEGLGKRIWKGIIDKDERAHQYEHSIEVQLPFLQFFSKKFEFVPICMGLQDVDTSLEVGEIISSAIKECEKDVVIIASSDFSHVGFAYGQLPPRGIKVNEWAERQDKMAIQKILQMDPKGLIKTVEEKNISMCGYGCVGAMITAARELGATKAELLKYSSSYEIQPGDSCVGYGSIIVK
jgi:hypothetical protein